MDGDHSTLRFERIDSLFLPLLHLQGRFQSRGDQYTVSFKILGELRVYLFLSPLFDQMYRLGLWPRHSERVGQQKQQQIGR